MSESLSKNQLNKLFKLILELKTLPEAKAFFGDLCTPNELEALSDRWRVAQMVHSGQSYREISEETGVSTATITRVGRSLKYGQGGYHWALINSHHPKSQKK